MLNRNNAIRKLAVMAILLASMAALAQNPTATGTINATLINKDGIALVFNSVAGNVQLGNNGSSAVTLNFGTVSAFGGLSAGVARALTPPVNPTSYTVSTFFDVQVIQGGLTSPNYTLSAQLAAAAPTGFTYAVDAVTLTAAAQNIQTNGTYNANVQHSLNLTISTAAPGAGGPAVGTPLTTTINFTATSN
jgi:hypothetical protein